MDNPEERAQRAEGACRPMSSSPLHPQGLRRWPCDEVLPPLIAPGFVQPLMTDP
jgi:hypothetical protein